MAMTDKEQKDLRAYCAFILKEYGFDIPSSDPIIPALYVIHKEMQLNNDSNKGIALQVKEAAARINPTVFNFNSEDAAFKFQLGIAIKWILWSGLIALFLAIAAWHWSNVNKVEQANSIVQNSGKLGELLKLVKKDDEGFYVIDFTAGKDDSIEFLKEFRKIDAKTVRIYLAKETK